MEACFRIKWLDFRPRPEALSFEVNRAKLTGNSYHLNYELLDSMTLTRVFAKLGNYLLPTSYWEGSPAFPSYPSGHASVAGAGATVLKAFFDGKFEFANIQVPNPSGGYTTLSNVNTAYPYKLNVNGELDKLASNYGFGRLAAGIHYRSDIEEGIRIGEAVAIEVLKEHILRYREKTKFYITKRDGKKIVIKNFEDGIEANADDPIVCKTKPKTSHKKESKKKPCEKKGKKEKKEKKSEASTHYKPSSTDNHGSTGGSNSNENSLSTST
jgi:hypothetical protein